MRSFFSNNSTQNSGQCGRSVEYSRSYEKGKSFNCTEYTKGETYYNNDFVQDFVIYEHCLYACVRETREVPGISEDWRLVVRSTDLLGATASVDNKVGTPRVEITTTGEGLDKKFHFEFFNLKGEKGDKGAKGDKGDRGDRGEQGIQGIQGIQGEVGPRGEVGPIGPQGVKGDKGDKGDRGPKGESGYDDTNIQIKINELSEKIDNFGKNQITQNGVPIVNSNSELRQLDVPLGSVASVVTTDIYEATVSELYRVPIEEIIPMLNGDNNEDEGLTNEQLLEILSNLSYIRGINPTKGIEDIEAGSMRIMICANLSIINDLAEDSFIEEDVLSKLAIIVLGRNDDGTLMFGALVADMFDDNGGEEDIMEKMFYDPTTGEIIQENVDLINKLFSERGYAYVIGLKTNNSDSSDIQDMIFTDEDYALFDSWMTVMTGDVNTKAYIKGNGWEQVGKSLESNLMFFALQYENTKLKDKLAELTERVNNIDITSIEVSVDDTTGTPSAEASISEGTFIINFKGLKGENGTDSTSNMSAGIGKPSMLGRDNDIYLDIESGIFYEFSKNEWFNIGTVSVGEESNVSMDWQDD